MRLKTLLVPIAAFVLAALLSVLAARATVTVVEERSVLAVREALTDSGHTWASVVGDGLQIILEGQAPSEARAFRAVSTAGSVVDASRVIDNLHVVQREAIAPPDFAIEILRNEGGITMIGLVPATTDREALSAALALIAGEATVADLLETADYPVPQGWTRALDFAIAALGRLPQSKVSVEAGYVGITAISANATQQRVLEADLAREAPDGVRLALSISAPRPVITPFTVRFILDGRGARFDACSADTVETQRVIVAAALDAGAEGRVTCRLGLGVPTQTWGAAVAMGIAAVADLGGGTLTLTDADISLVVPETVSEDDFDRIVGALSNRLPDVFSLDAVLTPPQEAQPEGPPQFTATRSPEGVVQLRGRVPDTLMNDTAHNYANARFGTANVVMGTRIVDGLPRGWSVRVLAGLDALSRLDNGSVVVQPDRITVRGVTGIEDASDEIAALMIDKLGADADFVVEVTYDAALDPIAAQPSPQDCLARIRQIGENRKITFDAGSATLSPDARPIVDEIAEILRLCPDLPLEIAGYTDSQGGEDGNRGLSQLRADAVLDGLRSRRVPVGAFVATGYGEEAPIADNDTAEGREANRRIEFRLIPGTVLATAADDDGAAPGVQFTVNGETYDFDPEVGGAFAPGDSPGRGPQARPDEISDAALEAVADAEAEAEAAGTAPSDPPEAAPGDTIDDAEQGVPPEATDIGDAGTGDEGTGD